MATPVRPSLKLAALAACVIIVVWCLKKPFHAPYQQSEALFLGHFAETLARTKLVESPTAHYLIPDFAQLQRYRAANHRLPLSGNDRVVFYGDSITDFWPTTFPGQFFPGKPYIGRGISGQSTPELVWRFQQDVIDLHPSIVILLAGANDVVLPTRGLTSQQTVSNLQTMVRIARSHGIHVIVCSILPISRFPQPQQDAFTAQIKTINSALQTLAPADHFFYLNYFTAMADHTGALRSTLSPDGVHPNAAGYAVMHTLAQSAIDNVTAREIYPNP